MKTHYRLLSLLLSLVMVIGTAAICAGSFTAAEADTAETSAGGDTFSWDNATVYFLLTDRFYNGNTANDHSYNRLKNKDGSIVNTSDLNSDVATFHGGDFAGITKKINEGYFDKLGVNAIWMSAPYEQIHGYVTVNQGRSDSIKHYAYHGYYALDYTQTDANFGTAAEFRTLVNTAHQHNIRVVLDIVMNHPGYNSIYDMLEYDYGAFKEGKSRSDIENVYYNWRYNGDYHAIIDYNSGNGYAGWSKWWGKNWLRAGLSGYDPVGNDPVTGSAGGDLPDFKTENQASLEIPTFLQTKWQKEGRTTAVNNMMNRYFSSTGNSRTVRNYLVCWLSEWVREYGVDGFRCDTAKHVELQSWKALSDECTKALKEWRKNNPSDPASKWTDDFWTTAEDYGSGVNNDSYYSQGGFDSKINFQFTGGGGVPGASNINGIYSDYAGKINSNANFNVLTYISSHDTALCRNDLYYQGSAFLMLPGAVQIFYGDESNRKVLNGTVGGEGDHLVRSDMNWSSTDAGVLAHWQKVGSFRNKHIAVGAGSHTTLDSSSGAGFARVYNKGNISDTVFAVVGASSNTNVKLKVGAFAPDGTELSNYYDGKTATVSGGYVTFNSGAHGTILIEVPDGPAKPAVSVNNTGGNFNTDTLTIKATLNDAATSGTYQIGSGKVNTFTKSATFTIGADMAYDQSVTVKFTATDGKTTTKAEYTYTKVDPNATPFKFPTARTVYLVDTASWGSANVYSWKDNAGNNGQWPGVAMTPAGEYEGHAVFEYNVPDGLDKIIFNTGGGATKTDDLSLALYSYYDNGAGKWVTVGEPVRPTETQRPTQKPTESKPDETAPVTGKVLLGDADSDGEVTVLDATRIQRVLAKLATMTAKQRLAADVTGDNDVAILDATEIQRWLAKLPTNYKINQYIGSDPATEATVKPTESQKPTEKPTESQPDDPTVNTVYFELASGTPNCYYWKSGGEGPIAWPGVAMTPVGGNVYKYDIPVEFDMVIFNGSGFQTGDLQIPGSGQIYNASSKSWSSYIHVEQPTSSSGEVDFNDPNTVYAVNDGGWGDVYLYYWGGSEAPQWPGTKMEKCGTHNGSDLYRISIPSGTTGLVFNIGSNQNQSGDLSPTPGSVFSTASKSFVSP